VNVGQGPGSLSHGVLVCKTARIKKYLFCRAVAKFKRRSDSQAWWYMPVITALMRKLRWQVSLDYIVRPWKER
jgi:hypothetical protein